MPEVHATLSASGSHRWLNCPPSVMLEKQFPSETSVYAQEGTLAHEIGEITLRLNLGEITKEDYSKRLDELMKDDLFTSDMPDYVDMYINTCLEKVSEARSLTPDAVIKVEQRLDFSRWVPKGFGTGDCVIIADGTLEICDLKYGKGVAVSAERNSQMMLYALGAINAFEFLYDIQKVRMTIIQPRLDSISSYEMTLEELMYWAEYELKPTAKLAMEGKGEFKAGDHCKFCKAKGCCKKRMEHNMELAQYEFQEPATMDNEDVAFVLDRVDGLIAWAEDVKKYALEQMLQGEIYTGYKVVEGRSIRKITNVQEAIEVLHTQGYKDEQIFKPRELQTLGALEKLVGKKNFNTILGHTVEKPQGKPTIVPESDKREPFNPAVADFK